MRAAPAHSRVCGSQPRISPRAALLHGCAAISKLCVLQSVCLAHCSPERPAVLHTALGRCGWPAGYAGAQCWQFLLCSNARLCITHSLESPAINEFALYKHGWEVFLDRVVLLDCITFLAHSLHLPGCGRDDRLAAQSPALLHMHACLAAARSSPFSARPAAPCLTCGKRSCWPS